MFRVIGIPAWSAFRMCAVARAYDLRHSLRARRSRTILPRLPAFWRMLNRRTSRRLRPGSGTADSHTFLRSQASFCYLLSRRSSSVDERTADHWWGSGWTGDALVLAGHQVVPPAEFLALRGAELLFPFDLPLGVPPILFRGSKGRIAVLIDFVSALLNQLKSFLGMHERNLAGKHCAHDIFDSCRK